MAIKFEKIEEGMILYDRHHQKAGNTNMSAICEWSVRVVALKENGAIVRWNGNGEQFWGRRRLEALYTWSMYDSTEAETSKGFVGVTKVKRLPKKERDRRKAEMDKED